MRVKLRKKIKNCRKKEAVSEPEIFEKAAVDESVKELNFTGQQRIDKGQLPVLDKIYDRAVRLFAGDIYQLTARDFEIKQDPLLIIKHRDFMGGFLIQV